MPRTAFFSAFVQTVLSSPLGIVSLSEPSFCFLQGPSSLGKPFRVEHRCALSKSLSLSLSLTHTHTHTHTRSFLPLSVPNTSPYTLPSN